MSVLVFVPARVIAHRHRPVILLWTGFGADAVCVRHQHRSVGGSRENSKKTPTRSTKRQFPIDVVRQPTDYPSCLLHGQLRCRYSRPG
jgi:hypothetical protein